ncbi:bifunctional acetaldehyde-CoA/alcohol dehydrogenase [Mycoplasma sp. (ex Biomphalaria glabrata)]|uniref:bifunctional acetaldehyde-CoA/alcohol dehydrogenase n=1 Tax=Mycoplasma sp. (ex Biomphalaria glabrata) TaxID=1749074 RepID=UPI00073AA945|nr:bifunctional acetaldehyde-CoA/alcohol dehydrogenase [Mycoplasma sp. (ex Biomphalaria glabrata)]ALV23537.1 bifunctional acetaldehyde-CoA/alcohol dehydrogenase [Mycoplasma sp. (ex Biomphalaria glabrata)]
MIDNNKKTDTKVGKLIQIATEAQQEYKNFTQEQVNKIFYEGAKAANNARVELAKMAVAETGMGVVVDKMIKNHYASEFIYNKYKDMKTVGVIESDEGKGYEIVAEPVGVVGAVIPTTNPTSTAIFKVLLALKTRNAIIISPHPRAKKCTEEAAMTVYRAAIQAGAPKGLVHIIQDPTLDDTQELMRTCNLILATGGGAMVSAAYSSGTPAIGVGAGNCPAIVDETADIPMAVSSIIASNMFDNGVVCATENSIVADKKIYDKLVDEFEKQGAYVVTSSEDIKKIEKGMFKDGVVGVLNAACVGQNPQKLGQIWGIDVPSWAKIIVVPATGSKETDALAWEKLSTYVSLYKAENFDHAIEIQTDLLQLGRGHTASLFCDESISQPKVDKFKLTADANRMVVNMPSSLGAIGDIYNFWLAPSLTLGCGTQGGNSFSENIGPKHLLNTKVLVKKRENMLWLQIPEKIYYKFGSLPVAFTDFKHEWNVKKAFIVSDEFIFGNFGKVITDELDNLGIDYRTFTGVEPNPSLATTIKGAEEIKSFQPDIIIAFGGGSSLDAAKLMWMYYEFPNLDFKDLAVRFADIRKRIVKYPKPGKLAKLVCIPTTSGTGSEVTPFAVITDEKTHTKYPLADYALTPNMAIIDSQFMLSMPPSITASTGLDALSHAMEAYVSIFATEFTDPYCLQAIKDLFEYLPVVMKNGKDINAREKVAHAATIAGIAFSNAFLGICHSLSHKVGGHLDVIHGIANSIFLPHVIAYNTQTGVKEVKAYVLPQYRVSTVRQKYVEIANAIGIVAKSEQETINELIRTVQKLSKDCGVWSAIKDVQIRKNGQTTQISEIDFYNVLDVMVTEAWDDQCTGANPRLPHLDDLKNIYINAYQGNDPIECYKSVPIKTGKR